MLEEKCIRDFWERRTNEAEQKHEISQKQTEAIGSSKGDKYNNYSKIL